MKRSAALASLLLGAALVGVAPPASAVASCGYVWGSLPESAPSVRNAEVVDVRAGSHPCFDRLVVDLRGDGDGYFVRYVDEVHHDGSGEVVPVAGGARLEVVVVEPVAVPDGLHLADGGLPDVSGFGTFRDLAWAGSFEGQTTFGLGVRARLPFRVFTLDGPGSGSRLVVDVANRW
ncbi:AMIN-like domain-containing (lipo)protein [Kineococcus sp. G2]|uniref:AMIN-like domain-containing (lipo)protein n=1 Tax=Kineococcus sp. G2 TaxID=3127484 RepID=UPI00301E066E